MTDRELIRLACENLERELQDVWLAKHIHRLGRRAGALALHISEEQYRYRLAKADRQMRILIDQRKDPA